ncbi:MAG: hypothetical protein AAB835_01765 [Patescibacteria group bacterium]
MYRSNGERGESVQYAPFQSCPSGQKINAIGSDGAGAGAGSLGGGLLSVGGGVYVPLSVGGGV